MAHESFEDSHVAQLLNQDFISIKVDREERPDIDSVYMTACQMLTGSGGWPLTILMTADQQPFYAGTYLPKDSRHGAIGIKQLLSGIAGEWTQNKKKLLEAGASITEYLLSQQGSKGDFVPVSKDLLKQGRDLFYKSYDKIWGGFGQAPKFPTPHNLLFLLRYFIQEKDLEAGKMAEYTLHQMYRGGIFDHIGGGFSRYSTDKMWLVPHFEKMLYDNALLTDTYLQAYKVTGNSFYADIAQKVMDYVLRELTDSLGGFYCGQDADSDGVEGKYYVFTPEEIHQILGKSETRLFCGRFGIKKEGSFEGKSIPNLIDTMDYEEEEAPYKVMRERLYPYRTDRARLHLDDKILTSWNGLMIAALAKASCLPEGEQYLVAAKKAHAFVNKNLYDDDGRLWIRWRDGEAANKGQLDDYAFYGMALIELYQSTFDLSYLDEALQLADRMIEFFWDAHEGGFYLYASDSEQLISRPKEVYDGAMPAGNSVAAAMLGSLARLTGETKWQEYWDKQLAFLARNIAGYPAGYSFAMKAMMDALYPTSEIICATRGDAVPAAFLQYLKEHPGYGYSILVKTPENGDALTKAAPFTANYPIPAGEDCYYICENKQCSMPVDLKGVMLSMERQK